MALDSSHRKPHFVFQEHLKKRKYYFSLLHIVQHTLTLLYSCRKVQYNTIIWSFGFNRNVKKYVFFKKNKDTFYVMYAQMP